MFAAVAIVFVAIVIVIVIVAVKQQKATVKKTLNKTADAFARLTFSYFPFVVVIVAVVV